MLPTFMIHDRHSNLNSPHLRPHQDDVWSQVIWDWGGDYSFGLRSYKRQACRFLLLDVSTHTLIGKIKKYGKARITSEDTEAQVRG